MLSITFHANHVNVQRGTFTERRGLAGYPEILEGSRRRIPVRSLPL